MKLERIVPWGRSFQEYQQMFDLQEGDLSVPILGCGDGPASFNAVLSGQGGSVVSVDPLYAFGIDVIARRIEETADQVLTEVTRSRAQFLWDAIPSPEGLRQTRMAAMRVFLEDYRSVVGSGRYVAASLPHLPFHGQSFGLVLCSHLLFTYTDPLDEAFHWSAIQAMTRVGREVRIFPLLTLDGRRSPYLELLLRRLKAEGCIAEVTPVPYEFQRGGNEMLRIVP